MLGNVKKQKSVLTCFFFFRIFFFLFNLSRRVTSPTYTLPELTCLPFTFFSLDSVLIELNYTLSTSGRERGERGGLHTQVVTFFFFLFSFGSLLGRDKKKITTRTTFFSPFSLLAIFLPLSLLYCYIREAGGVEGGCCCCWSDIYLYMSLNVFIRRRIIWSSRIVRTMLEVSIFFSGFVTMATARGGGDLVGFYQQCPATQKLEELKLHSWGNEKKKELAWYSY